MRPFDHGLVRVDRGVLARLHRLDRQLRVTWTPWAVDPLTGRVIETGTGKPVPDAAFYLWRVDEHTGRHYLVSIHARFGHREVRRLENDLARYMAPGEILEAFARHRANRIERRRAAWLEEHAELNRTNRKRIRELVFEGKTGYRTRKPVSFPGQTNRSTPGEVFLSDPKDDGWELPGPPAGWGEREEPEGAVPVTLNSPD